MKQKQNSSKKWWIITACIGGAALIGGGVFGIVSLINANKQLAMPTNLAVIELTDGTKKVFVDKSLGATHYLFSIQEKGGFYKEECTTTINQFLATDFLEKPTTYIISCQYLGARASNASQVLTVEYKSTITLVAPTLSAGTGADQGKLFFSTNTHYDNSLNLEYELTYTIGTEEKTSKAFTMVHDNKHGFSQGWFDIKTLIKQSGTYSFSVQVSATNHDYYLPSTSSQLQVTIE